MRPPCAAKPRSCEERLGRQPEHRRAATSSTYQVLIPSPPQRGARLLPGVQRASLRGGVTPRSCHRNRPRDLGVPRGPSNASTHPWPVHRTRTLVFSSRRGGTEIVPPAFRVETSNQRIHVLSQCLEGRGCRGNRSGSPASAANKVPRRETAQVSPASGLNSPPPHPSPITYFAFASAYSHVCAHICGRPSTNPLHNAPREVMS